MVWAEGTDIILVIWTRIKRDDRIWIETSAYFNVI